MIRYKFKLTLIELVFAIFVCAGLSSVLIPLFGGVVDNRH